MFEHCFNYFVVGNCPRVTVIEHRADGTFELVVNELTQELAISQLEQLKVGEHDLVLRHVQQRLSENCTFFVSIGRWEIV